MIDKSLSKNNLSKDIHETPDSLMQEIHKAVLKYLPNYKSYFLNNFLIFDTVKIVAKIIERENKLNKIVFEIVKSLF